MPLFTDFSNSNEPTSRAFTDFFFTDIQTDTNTADTETTAETTDNDADATPATLPTVIEADEVVTLDSKPIKQVNAKNADKPKKGDTATPSTPQIVEQLKKAGQDFEFYPTTEPILQKIAQHLQDQANNGLLVVNSRLNLVDIGAGNGQTLTRLQDMIITAGEQLTAERAKKGLKTYPRNDVDCVGYFSYSSDFNPHTDHANDVILPKYSSDSADFKPYFVEYVHLYAIEKSPILYNQIPKEVTLLGSDLYQSNLSVQDIDIIFSNPPFGDIKNFMGHLLNIVPSCAKGAYFVLPKSFEQGEFWQGKINRLKQSELSYYDEMLAMSSRFNRTINKDPIFRQFFHYEVLGEFDFNNADAERTARPQCVLVYLRFAQYYNDRYKRMDLSDLAFDDAFKEMFGEFERELNAYNKTDDRPSWCESDYIHKMEARTKELIENAKAVAQGKALSDSSANDTAGEQSKIDIIQLLTDNYADEYNRIITNYQKIKELDLELLATMQVHIRTIKDSLKERLTRLYTFHWMQLFEFYAPLKAHLTKQSRERLVEYVTKHHIAFTYENCCMVTIKAIQDTNAFMREQAITKYFDWAKAGADNHRPYKSNQKLFDKNDFAYLRKQGFCNVQEIKKQAHTLSPFALDFRIVDSSRGFGNYRYDGNELSNHSNNTTYHLLNDIVVIMASFGYQVLGADGTINTENTIATTLADFGSRYTEWGLNPQGEKIKLFEFKFFKNGNAHFFINQQFMVDFMVFIGRELGWLAGKTAQEVAEVLDVDLKMVESANQLNFVGTTNLPMVI